MNSDEKCPDCEEIWVLCDCNAYCEECGKHEEKCLCVDNEWEIETDDED
jgi:hypothetical protein